MQINFHASLIIFTKGANNSPAKALHCCYIKKQLLLPFLFAGKKHGKLKYKSCTAGISDQIHIML